MDFRRRSTGKITGIHYKRLGTMFYVRGGVKDLLKSNFTQRRKEAKKDVGRALGVFSWRG